MSPAASPPALRSADPGATTWTVRHVPLPNGEVVRRHTDLAGRRRLDEAPDGSWLRYEYDAEGHPSAVEHSSGESVAYNVEGGRWTATSGRATATITLDDEGLPVAVEQCAGRIA